MIFNGQRKFPLPVFNGDIEHTLQSTSLIEGHVQSGVPSAGLSAEAETNTFLSDRYASSASIEKAFSSINLHLNSILLEYPYEDLFKATDGFCKERCLGYGNHGTVFYGSLYGTDIAVKRLFSPSESGFEEEVLALSKFRHPNLVSLMGFARHGVKRLLVYEMLSAGDVQKSLVAGVLTWEHRLSIALDTATALCYLHNNTPRCIHRDLKTANILLNEHGSAKVADFGLSCLSKKQKDICVSCAAGTLGYADPLYVSSGIINEATDIYSFGAVLLELLTCQPPASQNIDGQVSFLVSAINFDLKKLLNFLDPKAKFPLTVSRTLAQLSLNCLGSRPRDRPTFFKIVGFLRSIKDSFIPKVNWNRFSLELSTDTAFSSCNYYQKAETCCSLLGKVHKFSAPYSLNSSMKNMTSNASSNFEPGGYPFTGSNDGKDKIEVVSVTSQQNSGKCARYLNQASRAWSHQTDYTGSDVVTTGSYPYKIGMKLKENITCDDFRDQCASLGQDKFIDEDAYFQLCLQFSKQFADGREQIDKQLRMEEERDFLAALEASKRDTLLGGSGNASNSENSQ